MPTNSTTPHSTKVLLGCSKCGATLPDNAEFCLKCGKPVSSPARGTIVVEVLPPAKRPSPPRKRRILLWILPALLVGPILWALTSDNPLAQQAQEFVGMKQDRTILDSAFLIGAHTFRYYKFALPEGSVNVAVVGQFQSTADTGNSNSRKAQPGGGLPPKSIPTRPTRSSKSADTPTKSAVPSCRTPNTPASPATRLWKRHCSPATNSPRFITALALIKPGKSLAEVDTKSVRKRMKDQAFARKVNRDDIIQGAAALGVDLDEHIAFCIEALKPVAAQLGPEGSAAKAG